VDTNALGWKPIDHAEKIFFTDNKKEQFTVLKHKFKFVLAGDKFPWEFEPYLGMSVQSRFAHYIKISNHEIFEIVRH